MNEFCPNKIKETPLNALIKQYRVKRKIDQFLYNFAYHTLIDKWNEKKLFRYANDFEIFSKEEIYNRINLLNNPVHSTTTFSYYLGTKLILDKFSEYPSVRIFKELLTKPLLPSDLI